jgi:hypothetical protein
MNGRPLTSMMSFCSTPVSAASSPSCVVAPQPAQTPTRPSATTLESPVFGNDNGTSQSTSYQATVKACSAAAGSAACGTTRWSSGTNYQLLQLTGAALNQLATYSQPYLYITLPPIDSTPSAIVGVTFSKP